MKYLLLALPLLMGMNLESPDGTIAVPADKPAKQFRVGPYGFACLEVEPPASLYVRIYRDLRNDTER